MRIVVGRRAEVGFVGPSQLMNDCQSLSRGYDDIRWPTDR